MWNKNIYLTILASVFVFVMFSCKRLVEVSPPVNSLVRDNVYASDETAISFMNGLYTSFGIGGELGGNGGFLSISLYAGLSADELRILDEQADFDLNSYYRNSLTSVPGVASNYWNFLYPLIYQCNTAIEGMTASTSLSLKIKQQLIGEAKFMRALSYFYLVNLYGGVPLITTTNYNINAQMPRSTTSEVWKQIVVDLNDSKSLMSSQFLEPDLLASKVTSERTRPISWAAAALLARVYLYTDDYENAERYASLVIDSSHLFSLPPLNEAFLKNSPEAIFQLQPTSSATYNTVEGSYFVLPSTGPSLLIDHPAYLNTPLLYSFERGDLRRKEWIDSIIANGSVYYYPFKYKLGSVSNPGFEYSMILRLGEQYLIRAEARIRLNKIVLGIIDLNTIRNRAINKGLPIEDPDRLPLLSESLSGDSALAAVAHERQIELFSELGHRWLDIKRAKKVDEVMNVVSKIKQTPWESYQQFYPIPLVEIQRNPSLAGAQNVGYQ